MKKTELTTLRSKEIKELAKVLEDKKRELAKIMPKIASQGEKNYKKGAAQRRDIAQILTIIREKEILAKEGAKKA